MFVMAGFLAGSAYTARPVEAAPQQAAAASPAPTVTGPVKNTSPLKDGAHGYPFNATPWDLKKAGYVEEEFFLEGTASRFAISATANATVTDSGHPYRTRLVVRRPAAASRFNGTAVVEWTNVSQLHDHEVDWFLAGEHLMRAGYAWIGVSAQADGVNALKEWSPARYGSLNVSVVPVGGATGGAGAPRGGGAQRGGGAPAPRGGPIAGLPDGAFQAAALQQGRGTPGPGAGGRGGAPGGGAPGGGGRGGPGGGAPGAGGRGGPGGGGGQLSEDIFTQAALAIRGKGKGEVMGPLKVERMIAIGHSQSCGRLANYFNSVHPLSPVYEAVVLHGCTQAVRTDLNVKIFNLLSESEGGASRQDTDKLRVWQVAGTSHLDAKDSRELGLLGLKAGGAAPVDGPGVLAAPTISGAYKDEKGEAVMRGVGTYQGPSAPNDGCAHPTLSRVPFHYAMNAAMDHVNRWVKDGTLPPVSPRFELNGNAIVRDERGNARGAIQLAQHAVPTALNRGDNPGSQGFVCGLLGWHEPFDAATLAKLYPSHDAYVKAVQETTEKNVKAGFLLKADADATIAEAKNSKIGKR
jgi:hypothetical protein